ncbi:phosphoribosylformylglycinamidine synthase [Hathewaya proteolytica DSM 3090]|uniref:Phosphoribosylformylglycinamidine synthase n=1 Tax=Hathewaya proteolytica DSM 3090 TaxID=1121331 RepID=A0A1M6P6L1_9CLOT|nr:phosphoribosylformylglycinamidine synthase [Hathewaya proteolytica]SHK03538.1 phosphoribosylformylglycinamidine synthase [Hathewaya proteolytica DSM 3090]
MSLQVFRAYVEKKANFNIEAERLLRDFRENLKLTGIEKVRLMNRYDVEGCTKDEFELVKKYILSEPNVDEVFDETLQLDEDKTFAVEYLEGQYDQRADSAEQCIQLILKGKKCNVKNARVIVLEGNVSKEDLESVKNYYINKVDSKEASLEMRNNLKVTLESKDKVETIEKFNSLNEEELKSFIKEMNLAMSFEDAKLCQEYFNKEKRNPTITEIKVIDTYWSDHCRHTTFNTVIEKVEFEDGKYVEPAKKTYDEYVEMRKSLYKGKDKAQCLMDMAVIAAKKLRAEGKLDDLDKSEEINACSIVVPVMVDNKEEKWLLMFKNETHNHPTEIEPFGGASTCLGGAIRDPLSGRSYVYGAMRLTGAADPTVSISETIKGKLPQSKITKEAAKGYSSYGNQIGLAAGQITEVYDEGFMAKRMEVGAVIGAAPYENVIRETPEKGDVVVLLGGRTGRDGCGGASGSSKEHDEKSILNCGAEVQKGNAPTERKIQRLFRNPNVTTLIKRCNDFGAGGVSVAIGELSDGLNIDLDKVPKKYAGLDGTELAISESQERMAVVIRKEDVEKFIAYSEEENLEAVVVAEVTDENRVRMNWKGNTILDLDRDFLNTNGAKQYTNVKVVAPKEDSYFENRDKEFHGKNIKEAFLENLKDLNVCSQKGLVEMFDSSVGAGTVFMPFGGKYQLTPNEVLCMKLPVLHGETTTTSLMSFGYNPKVGKWSPFHGALYAVVDSVAKIVAAGGDYRKVRLSFQEYFEKLGNQAETWGKPFAALLGSICAQNAFGIPAIGGKDSMSGTFKDISVPPTLISFAVTTAEMDELATPEFKKANSKVVVFKAPRDNSGVIDFNVVKRNYEVIKEMIKNKTILAASACKFGGVAENIAEMCFGNKLGFRFSPNYNDKNMFSYESGSIICELNGSLSSLEQYKDIVFEEVGEVINEQCICMGKECICLHKALNAWQGTLEKVFPSEYADNKFHDKFIIMDEFHAKEQRKCNIIIKEAKPAVLIPVFPGSNCEYDCMRAFEKAGAEAKLLVFNNMSPAHIEESIGALKREIGKSQIIMLPGGFSSGDEPDGSGKFISAVFRNELVKEAVRELLNNRDGLMLGVCNGFQALIKLGLVPFGDIVDTKEDAPTLTFNALGRHISQIVSTKIVSNKSPWFSDFKTGEIVSVPVSHGEGRFYGNDQVVRKLFENGQVATQYVDCNGNPTYDVRYNPNGSVMAIEGITSLDGRILGKMGHTERISNGTFKNVIGNYDERLFKSGVEYFK